MAVYSSHTDQELVALIKQGDHAAFREVYDRYSPKVFYQVNQMLRDPEIAKDITQELFITVWSKSGNIKEDVKLGGYLYIAAQNSVFKYIQRSKLQGDYLQSLAEFSTQLRDTTTESIDEKELHKLIDLHISKLPPKMRQIFELSRVEELSYREIAAQLDISEQTVKNQVSSALKILREKVAPHASSAMFIMVMLKRE